MLWITWYCGSSCSNFLNIKKLWNQNYLLLYLRIGSAYFCRSGSGTQEAKMVGSMALVLNMVLNRGKTMVNSIPKFHFFPKIFENRTLQVPPPPLKGTVNLISSDLLWRDGNSRFTMVLLTAFSMHVFLINCLKFILCVVYLQNL